MKKVIFSTNLPSPYRVDFFNELGKGCELTVLYERKNSAERDEKWTGEKAKNFKEIYLNLEAIGTDRSKGSALKDYIKKADFDLLILTNYVSPSTIEAIRYCKKKKIPYYVEYDGGAKKKDPIHKRLLKQYLLGSASGHFTTSDEHKAYLEQLGIGPEKIYKYPFTSIKKEDLDRALTYQDINLQELKEKLGMTEEKILLSVGRFSYEAGYGKGYDVLMKLAKELPGDIGIYIVGDEPTEEFLQIKEKNKLEHVHFVGFKRKAELQDYYAAADLFILLTRGDVWGLVVNEAMMHALPVISTPFCIAAKELVKEGENGYLVGLEEIEPIKKAVLDILEDEKRLAGYSKKSLEMIQDYTIEKMAERHMEIFGEIIKE